jgi:hypothetical protein
MYLSEINDPLQDDFIQCPNLTGDANSTIPFLTTTPWALPRALPSRCALYALIGSNRNRVD